MGPQEERKVLHALGQMQQLSPQLARCFMLRPCDIKRPQSYQHWEELWSFPHLQRQLSCPGAGALYLRGRIPLGGYQSRAQGGLQEQLLVRALGGVWQGPEQLQPLGEVTDRFLIGRTLDGSLARLLPVGNSILKESCFGIVIREQLRLDLNDFLQPLLQNLRNLFVRLLP